MHSFYVIADIGYGRELLKLYIEEMNNPNKNDTDKRVYMLQAIENQQFGVKGSHLTASLSAQIAGIKTIADLHTFVKQYDSDFNPPESSKVVDKDGKPLVVYHQTSADFTVVDTESKGAGRFDGETPNSTKKNAPTLTGTMWCFRMAG